MHELRHALSPGYGSAAAVTPHASKKYNSGKATDTAGFTGAGTEGKWTSGLYRWEVA